MASVIPVYRLGPHDCYFYSCKKCGRLLTYMEERKAISTGQVCPCGARTYTPTDLRWHHRLLPRVWKMYLLAWIGCFDHSRAGY